MFFALAAMVLCNHNHSAALWSTFSSCLIIPCYLRVCWCQRHVVSEPVWACGNRRGTSKCSHAVCDLCFAAFDPQIFSLMRRADLKISDRVRCYPCIFAYAATTRCDGLGPAGRMNCTTIVPFACALQQNRAVDICETCRIMRRSTSG